MHSASPPAPANNNFPRLSYRPDIDGLRALAVLSVIGYHYFPVWVKGGFIGVDIFFVISGFLIGGILIDSLNENRFSLRDFYIRRILRILPALLLVLGACLAFGWFALLPIDYQNLGKHTAGGAGFVTNLLLWKEAGYFDAAAEHKPLLHLWSLGIEEQFYLVIPLVLLGLWKKNLRLATFLGLLAVISYKCNLVAYEKDPVFDFYLPVTRFWELFAGVLLALWERRAISTRNWLEALGLVTWEGSVISARNWLRTATRYLIFRDAERARHAASILPSFLSLLGLALLVLAIFTARAGHFPGKYALAPVLGAVLLIAAGPRAIGNRLLAFKPAVWIGLISYPLYLWHWPLLSYARIIIGGMPERTFRIAMFAVALILAALTWWLIERPIRFGKRARGKKAIVLLAILVFIGSMGGWVYRNEGLPERPANEEARKFLKEDFEFPPLMDDACKQRYGDEFEHCRYKDVGGKSTVALLGDSHALVVFLAISEYLAQQGYNTFTIGSGGTKNPVNGLSADPGAVSRLFERLGQDKSIKKAFLITRGVVYVTGWDIDVDGTFSDNSSSVQTATQKSIDGLRKLGIDVYLVAENPVMPKDWKPHQSAQPLRSLFHLSSNTPDAYRQTRKQVLEHQKEYLEMIARLERVTVLNTIDTFCPEEECLLSDENGAPLYWDDDHLSQRTGGQFLLDKVLKPHLLPSE